MSRTYKDIRNQYVTDIRERNRRSFSKYHANCDFCRATKDEKPNRKTDKLKAIKFELQVA